MSTAVRSRVLLTVWLTALQGCARTASSSSSSPLQSSGWGNQRRFVHLRSSTDLNNFYLEVSPSGHVRKSTHRGPYSVFSFKAESRDRIAIFGVKSNRFLCMDGLGNLFTSSVCHRDDCLFHHKLLENHRDVYYSPRSGILLNLDGMKQPYAAGRNLPQSSLFMSEKNSVPLERLQHRERRDRETGEGPESPRARSVSTRPEDFDSRAARDDDLDLEVEAPEERNTSREAVRSLNEDDPWEVAHARIPSSPRKSGNLG